MEKLLDGLDRKILHILTKNARVPIKDIAVECEVSRAAVHQHIQRMLENGTISGSGFQVNPKMLGYSLCAYVGITLENGAKYNAVIEELEKIPEIVESQFTLGSFSMLIKVYAHDDQHLFRLLNREIQEIPGITKTETLLALEQRINRQVPMD